MRPSEWKTIKDGIYSFCAEISSLRQMLDQRGASISGHFLAEQKTEQDRKEEIGHAIDNLANQQRQSSNAAETNQERRHGQNLFPQRITALATSLAFVAAAIYAGFACFTLREAQKQTTAAQDTLAQVRNQTTLMHDQLVGSQGAIVAFNPYIDGDYALIRFRNLGVLPARKVHAKLSFSEVSIATHQPIGRLFQLAYSYDSIAGGCPLDQPSPCTKDENPHLPWPRPAPADIDIKTEEWPYRNTVEVTGEITFENGFHETSTLPICQMYLSPMAIHFASRGGGSGNGGFLACEVFDVDLRGFIDAARRQQAEHPK